jgi:16S rRNA (guanine527-N7)-methyltransferase
MSHTTTPPRELLIATARAWGLTLDDRQVARYERYAAELVRWNERTNLTTITDPHGVVVRHLLDSLALARIWPDQPPDSLADIGTGAGFPGLALKILWPDLRLLLVESIGKKTEFLQHVAATLELSDVEVVTARAEEVGRDSRYREQYHAVTARAVAALPVLAEYCLPLCRIGGTWLAPKGADGEQEAADAAVAIERLGGRLRAIMPYALPGVESRVIIVVDKIAATPAQYPRRAGIPQKRPL